MNATVTRVIERTTSLPLFELLFLISVAVLGTLVAAQGRTMKSQRSLIHLLMRDDANLAIQYSGQAPPGSPAHSGSQSEPASGVRPPVQPPSAQAPAIKANPQVNVKPGRKSRKAGEPLSIRPPAELTDPSDIRRVTLSI